MGLLLKNGDVVTAEATRRCDVRCRDGRIVELGPDLAAEGDEIVDATGLLVLPGGIDPHVHLSLPVAGTVSSDDFESGTAAALAGGTTTVIDFVHPERGESFLAALETRLEEGRAATCDYSLHMAVTWWGEETARWMAECVERGVPSFKAYMAYKTTVGLEDTDLIRVLDAIAELDALLLVHAEHGDAIEHLRSRFAASGHRGPRFHPRSRPAALEGEATNRAVVLAGLAGARLYVVHVTCREALSALAAGRAAGWRVAGETCPQYLLLDDSEYERPDFEGAAYVIAPPLRTAADQGALWTALADGTLAAVGTDHCPFTMEQKRLGQDDFRLIPGGAGGVEHRLALLWTHGVRTGRFDAQRFVDLVATGPARLFGLYPRKGTVAVGSDADLVLWDPDGEATISAATHRQGDDRSIYEGFHTVGRPTTVVAGGEIRFSDGELRAEPGAGRFVPRRPTLPRRRR